MIRGAGSDRLWDAAAKEWLQAAPEPQAGWSGDVSSFIRAPIPPRIVLHTSNVLRATEIHTWGRDAAAIRRLPPEGGAARLTVAHFKTWGPVYDDALSRLGDILGPLLLMLPTNLATALRQELDSCDGCDGWEAVADSNLLALLHRDAADECQWDTLVPHLTERHMYMATPPRGHPRPAWDDLIAAFHDHGILLDDTWGRSGRRRSARTTGAAFAPARWSSGIPSARGGTTSSSAASGPGRRPPSSHTPATSAGNATGYPPQRRRAPTRARSAPRWPRAPGPNLPRARTCAQKRRLCTGASGEHTLPKTNARAPRAPPSCGSTCTCWTPHPSHVFAP